MTWDSMTCNSMQCNHINFQLGSSGIFRSASTSMLFEGAGSTGLSSQQRRQESLTLSRRYTQDTAVNQGIQCGDHSRNKQTNTHHCIYIYMIYTYSYQTCKLIRVPYESNTQCHVSKKRVQKTVPWSKSATHPIFIRTASTPGWLRRQYLKYFFLLRAIMVWWLITAISYLRSLHAFRRPFRL